MTCLRCLPIQAGIPNRRAEALYAISGPLRQHEANAGTEHGFEAVVGYALSCKHAAPD